MRRLALSARPPTPTGWPAWRQWLLFVAQAVFIVGIELSDDTYHGFVAPRPPGPPEAHAVAVMDFEQRHGFWIEPALQRFFEHTHQILGLTMDWSEIVPAANVIHGFGHGVVTCAFA